MCTGPVGLLVLVISLLQPPAPAHGQTETSTRHGPLVGAEVRVSSYLGHTVPTASLLFYRGGHGFSVGGKLSATLRSVTEQRPNGYRRMGPLVRIGPTVRYAARLSKQTGYYAGLSVLVGGTKIEERSHDVVASVPKYAAGVTPTTGLFVEPAPDLRLRVGTSLWIGRMPWSREIRVLPALAVSALL